MALTREPFCHVKTEKAKVRIRLKGGNMGDASTLCNTSTTSSTKCAVEELFDDWYSDEYPLTLCTIKEGLIQCTYPITVPFESWDEPFSAFVMRGIKQIPDIDTHQSFHVGIHSHEHYALFFEDHRWTLWYVMHHYQVKLAFSTLYMNLLS